MRGQGVRAALGLRTRWDVEHLYGRGVEARKSVCPDDALGQIGDVPGPVRGGRGNARREAAGLDRSRNATLPFDLLKQDPGRLAEAVGQRLEPAGAGGRIFDLGEMRLVEEHTLHVAGEPPRAGIWQSDGQGERENVDHVGASETGGDRRG